jgi:hypothetical protein
MACAKPALASQGTPEPVPFGMTLPLGDGASRFPVALGVAESIEHRTGLALGIGLDLPRRLGPRGRRSRVRAFVHLDAQATWAPGSAAAQASVVFSAGTWLGIGRRPVAGGAAPR